MIEATLSLSLREGLPLLSVSDGIGVLLGFSAEAFRCGQVHLRERIHADDQDIATALFSLQPGPPGPFNLRLRRADGRIVCVRGEARKDLTSVPPRLELLLQDAKSLPRTMDDASATANFRAMMENTDDFIYFKDRNHVFTGASQTLVSLCEPVAHWTDLLGLTDYDVFPEAYADIYYRLEKQVFSGAAVACEIQETLSRDGRAGWVDNRKHPILNAAGEIVGLYGIARDVTERVRVEQELKASEARFRSLYNSMIEGVALHELVFDASNKVIDYVLLDANPAFERHTGIAKAQAVGQRASQIYGTNEAPFLDLYAEVARTGVPLVFDRYFAPIDKHFLISAFSPGPRQFVTVFDDVTESKRFERELRQSEQRFRELLENTPNIAVQGYDAARRVIFWNQASEKLYGYSKQEALGRQLEDLIIPEEMRPGVVAAVSAWAAGGPAIPAGELTLMRKDGSSVSVYSSHVMQAGSAGLEMFCLDIDLSARKAAEADSRAKSSFLANMSHEIRTPMNAILGLTSLLQRRARDPEQSDKLHKIMVAGQHLLEIINDVLDLSKIDAGMLTLESKPVDIAAIVADVTTLLHERAQEKHLELVSEIPPLPRGLTGDSTRLRQALLNYATNAIKFTPAGRVTLRAAVVDASDDGVLLRVEVSDTGIGIAEDVLPRLFSSFEQADNSITRQYGGTGLGLAITRKIARLMGGDAGCSSRLGAGSTFWFTARLGQTAPPAEEAPCVAAESPETALWRDFAGSHVLIVEDEPVNREITLLMLADVGITADIAEDGQRALELARTNAYDAILMDMQMPGMDGLEATRQIRTLPGHARTPILAMTANVFNEDRDNCLAAGMDDFLPKPVLPDALFDILLRALAARHAAA